MSEEIPLKPISRKDIHRLETALIIATLLRPDVIEKVKHAEERLTWIDALAIAAGALARERAGIPVSQIADELGRTEATIRKHLSEKSEAGKLVKETFNRFAREGVRIELPTELVGKDIEDLKKKLAEREEEIKVLREKLGKIKYTLE
ncbi:MAG TPA: transcriptional regulator, partial [Thermoprotei archaeon]|nr:transcriptional regulator [Thermoprotei archaeon]